MNNADRVYKKAQSVLSKMIGEDFILVPIRDDIGDLAGKVYILKGAGVDIWRLLDGQNTLRDIKDTIVKEFRAESEEAENDTILFIRQLEDRGLVVRRKKGGKDERKQKKEC